tara:strand:- start:301 stop:534 length:234 start_codon:yes stop_codon:yes gene_type:complete
MKKLQKIGKVRIGFKKILLFIKLENINLVFFREKIKTKEQKTNTTGSLLLEYKNVYCINAQVVFRVRIPLRGYSEIS